jgi:uncharacterized protein YutE (UPF0331/DUF86 family)
MHINKDLLAKKLDFLNEHLSRIENMDFDQEALSGQTDIQDLLTFRLQQSVETCIDIATHIISGLNLKRKETAKDAFLLLGEEKIITKDLADKMGQAANFRNRVVHGYNDFDFNLLFKDYKEDIKDLHTFGAQILSYLSS